MMMLFGAQISVASRVREATKQTDHASQSSQYGTKNDSTAKDCIVIRQTEVTSKQIENMTQEKMGVNGGYGTASRRADLSFISCTCTCRIPM